MFFVFEKKKGDVLFFIKENEGFLLNSQFLKRTDRLDVPPRRRSAAYALG